MSASSQAAFEGLSAARARLQTLVEGLKAAGRGDVVKRAAERVGDAVRAVAESKLSRHVDSGAAASSTVVDVVGGRVDLHGMPPANGKQWSGKSYLATKKWWPFRTGKMPPFVVKRAQRIFAEELQAALGTGGDSPAAREAAAIMAEAAASDEKAAAKATTKRGKRS